MTKDQIKNFWIAFFAVMTILATVVAIHFAMESAQSQTEKTTSENARANSLSQCLYELTDSIKNIDVNLSKLTASNNSSMQTELLLKLSTESTSAVCDLSYLPIEQSEQSENLTKYFNQVADYSQSLIKKISQGNTLTANDKKSLKSLQKVASQLKSDFENVLNENSNLLPQAYVGEMVTSFEPFEYEKLIYDGPFSDSLKNGKIHQNKTLSEEELVAIATKTFNAQSVQKLSKNNSEKSTLFEITTQNGSFYADILNDGRLLEVSGATPENTNEDIKNEQSIRIAEDFCLKCGYKVRAIWVSRESANTTYVNLAPCPNGVVVYPELVKVAIAPNGEIVGFEARSYLLNHKERFFDFNDYNEQKARECVSKDLKITNVNKAFVQKGENGFLCYEIECETSDGTQYFIYLDKNL